MSERQPDQSYVNDNFKFPPRPDEFNFPQAEQAQVSPESGMDTELTRSRNSKIGGGMLRAIEAARGFFGKFKSNDTLGGARGGYGEINYKFSTMDNAAMAASSSPDGAMWNQRNDIQATIEEQQNRSFVGNYGDKGAGLLADAREAATATLRSQAEQNPFSNPDARVGVLDVAAHISSPRDREKYLRSIGIIK